MASLRKFPVPGSTQILAPVPILTAGRCLPMMTPVYTQLMCAHITKWLFGALFLNPVQCINL